MKRGPVLVVDDDQDLQELLRLLLEGEGYAVQLAGDGLQALARVAEAMPALILLDMNMPVLNGWQFARALREAYAAEAAPIVVVTAARDARRSAADIHADAWIGKPFDIDEVLELVRRYLAAA
jgi:CheY-like chemotaxis protein